MRQVTGAGRSAATGIAATIWLLSGAEARADLVLCNASDAPIRLASALADSDDRPVTALGSGALAPAACRTFGGGDPETRLFFVYTSEPGFTGPQISLCLPEDPEFHLELATGCSAPGDQMANYRRIELPEGEEVMILNLDGAGGYVPIPEMPFIDASQTFTPGAFPEQGTDELAEYVLFESGLTQGSYGQSFEIEGVWQGCETGAEGLVCRFYSSLTLIVARDGEAYPPEFLPALADLPMGTAVLVRGDVLYDEEALAEVAISSVEVLPETPFWGLFQAIQGAWQSEDDGSYEFDIAGSEIDARVAGETSGKMYLQLGVGCPEAAGDGPTLTTYHLGDQMVLCFEILELSDARMVLGGEDGPQSFIRR